MDDNKNAAGAEEITPTEEPTEVEATVVEPDLIAQKDAEIAKLKEERENYKKVALKRLGKLPADADFMAGEKADDSGLTVEEQVRNTLVERELEKAEQEREEQVKKLAKENAELRLALKNRPGSAMGGSGSGDGGVQVNDNVFSPAQIAELTRRAQRLGADPQKFIADAKKNLASR